MYLAIDIGQLDLENHRILRINLRSMAEIEMNRLVLRQVPGITSHRRALPLPVRKGLHSPILIPDREKGRPEEIENSVIILHGQSILTGCLFIIRLDRLYRYFPVSNVSNDRSSLIDFHINIPEILCGT